MINWQIAFQRFVQKSQFLIQNFVKELCFIAIIIQRFTQQLACCSISNKILQKNLTWSWVVKLAGSIC